MSTAIYHEKFENRSELATTVVIRGL